MLTSDWLQVRINSRLPEQLLAAVEASAPQTSVRGVHPNWRIARYRDGETFPAHQVYKLDIYRYLNIYGYLRI